MDEFHDKETKIPDVDHARNTAILKTITKFQSLFITNTDTRILFEELLSNLLSLAESEYGFIGDILYKQNGEPYLKTMALTNISWNDETRALYDKYASMGMEFTNLRSLFGVVMTTGKAVISNDPSTDPRRCGIPDGHPPLNSFMGLPLYNGKTLVGMIGVANRPGGYKQDFIEYLQPLLTTCAQMIEGYRLDQQRKKAEEALRESEQRLLQAQKMEALGQLTGGIAHDFNNILTGIIGYANLITMKANIDTSIMNYSKNIMDLSERAAKLIQGLLTFSRKQVVSLSPTNLNLVIRNFENLLAKLIREDIKLCIDMSGEDLVIMANNGQIEQVIMNLITNARDAMPEGGRLTISTELVRFDDNLVFKTGGYGNPGLFACLSISDTGTGMDDTTKERIFEPFFTTKEVGKGTGLGLSIVYGIVNGHKGSINVYSEPGIGTTFRIYFPLINAEAGKEVSDAPEPLLNGTETILVTEDDADVTIVTKTILEEHGYNVITACDGEDAVIKFRDGKEMI